MTFPRDPNQDGNQVPAPDPNAPGTLVSSAHPERYSEPFYLGNVMVVRCKEPDHDRSTVFAVPVELVREHDAEHDDV